MFKKANIISFLIKKSEILHFFKKFEPFRFLNRLISERTKTEDSDYEKETVVIYNNCRIIYAGFHPCFGFCGGNRGF